MAFINVVFLLFILFSSSIAYARDENGKVFIFSAGSHSCGQMTEDVAKTIDGKAVYTAYIDGYLSAVNAISLGKENFFEDTDSISRYKFVLKYCEENPLDKVIEGINNLILRYRKTLY